MSALADFTDQSGTGTAVGIGGAQLSVTNQYAYKTSYEAGIWGDVKKYALDINSGVLPSDANGNPINAPLWSAATQLDLQAAVSGPVLVARWIGAIGAARANDLPMSHGRFFSRMSCCKSRRVMSSPTA